MSAAVMEPVSKWAQEMVPESERGRAEARAPSKAAAWAPARAAVKARVWVLGLEQELAKRLAP